MQCHQILGFSKNMSSWMDNSSKHLNIKKYVESLKGERSYAWKGEWFMRHQAVCIPAPDKWGSTAFKACCYQYAISHIGITCIIKVSASNSISVIVFKSYPLSFHLPERWGLKYEHVSYRVPFTTKIFDYNGLFTTAPTYILGRRNDVWISNFVELFNHGKDAL